MSKDTISVNMNVYDIPILVEQLKKLEQENKQLKNILTELEEWLKSNAKKIEMYADNYRKRNGRLENIEKTPIVGFAYSGKIGIQDTLDKIQKLKEKYK